MTTPGPTAATAHATTPGASPPTTPLAVVTGASTGIGRALAAELAEHGYAVVIAADEPTVSPGPYRATYAASTALVHSFAEGIRHELKDTGVTVTSLMPGPTETESVAGSFKNRLQAELGTHLPDALAAPIMARMTKPRSD